MMTQTRPIVIDADDIPEPSNFVEDLLTKFTDPDTPETPAGMYKHLLNKAHTHAVSASEHAYQACDWFALFDRDTADRYRKSARHLYELSEHLLALMEES
jgi:hypothetical protein